VPLLLDVARLVIDISMWLVLSRLVLGLFVRRESGPFWQVVVRATEPIYRVTRLITGGRVPEGWLGVLSLVGLGLLRVPIALALRSAAP
jgi:hypothetical protein